MRIIWEAKDIKGGVRFGGVGSETWMIGWPTGKAGFFVTISLSDGLVTDPALPADIAQRLSQNGYLPIELLPFAGPACPDDSDTEK